MKKVFIVPGLFGGLAKKNYEPLAELFGTKKFEIIRAGSDWRPQRLANIIRQNEEEKVVVCLSLGATVGNLLANDSKTTVYHICPFIGNGFNRRVYPQKLRLLFRGLAFVCMAITKPFKNHRWYPLFGGTRPDGHFLSLYAIFQQLWYSFDKTPEIYQVAGVVFSDGDKTVSPEIVKKRFQNTIVAKRADGKNPSHCNFRKKNEKFGKKSRAKASEELGEDAKAYILALSSLIKRSH